jgi:hypothetical protein
MGVWKLSRPQSRSTNRQRALLLLLLLLLLLARQVCLRPCRQQWHCVGLLRVLLWSSSSRHLGNSSRQQLLP